MITMPKPYHSTFALTALLLFLSGCSLEGPESVSQINDRLVFTDRVRYVSEQGRTIIEASVTNTTGHSIYAPGGAGPGPVFFLEKAIGQTWVEAYSPPLTAILEEPREIRSGETITTLFFVYGLDDPSRNPAWRIGEVEGTYRLVAWLQEEEGEADDGFQAPLLPAEVRSSAPIEIVR